MHDPLLYDVPFTLYRRFYPLGFPLDLFTNSEAVLAAAGESWGDFNQLFDRPSVMVRIGITDDADHRSCAAPLYRGFRNLMSISAEGGDFGVCDLCRRFGFGWLNPGVAGNSSFLRYFYIEAMGYVLISAAWLAPIHAACVDWNGHGVLLCGESGAGKSSLAYACARAGWTYVCDDASFLLREGESLLVTGNPHQIRLRDTAAGLFPEFAGAPVTIRPNGKPTIEIATRSLRSVGIAPLSTVQSVIFLDREPGRRPSIAAFPKEQALRRWSEMIVYGDDESRSAQRKTLHRLLKADVYRFRYSDVDSAVACLDAMFRPRQKAG